MSGINPNIDGSTPISQMGPTSPISEEEGGSGSQNDATVSTLSPSQQEALMVLYLMNAPMLVPPEDPNGNYSISPEAIGAMVATRTAEIGSQMWDSYLEHLAEQKERIKEELESPRYQAWLEQQSPAFIAKIERGTQEQSKAAVLSSTEYNTWIQNLPATQREEELNRNRAGQLWTDMIGGVSSYIQEAQGTRPEAVAFMAASFVIACTFIGDYMSIVDVSSTNMVAVNPVQDAVGSIAHLIPQQLQESFTLTVNLFAVGLIHFANAEAISKAMQTGKPPATQETVDAFAKSVLEKVKGNEVNALLMAILVNKFGNVGEVTDNRMLQLVAMAKLVMLSIAMAAVYQSATGWMTPEILEELMEGNVEAKSEEDQKQFVSKFAPLHEAYMEVIRDGIIPDYIVGELTRALQGYMVGTQTLEDLLDPTKVYQGIAKNLENQEPRA